MERIELEGIINFPLDHRTCGSVYGTLIKIGDEEFFNLIVDF